MRGSLKCSPLSPNAPLCCYSLYACRFNKPWPKLEEYAASMDLDNIDDVTHRHVPYGELFRHVMLRLNMHA